MTNDTNKFDSQRFAKKIEREARYEVDLAANEGCFPKSFLVFISIMGAIALALFSGVFGYRMGESSVRCPAPKCEDIDSCWCTEYCPEARVIYMKAPVVCLDEKDVAIVDELPDDGECECNCEYRSEP